MFNSSLRIRIWIFAVLAFVIGQANIVLAQTAGKREIVVGYSISITGKFGTEGADVHRAYQYWAEEVNRQGGIQIGAAGSKLPVRLVQYDDGSDTNTAIRNYERLITKDEVDLLLSPWGSGHNFAVTALTEKYKYPMVLSSAGSDRIFERGFKYIFSTTQLASRMYDGLVDYAKSASGDVKTVAIAYENFLFTQSLHDALLPKLKQAGLQIVADEQYPMGGQDFTGILTRIKATNPDAFVVINIMPSSVYLTRQMGEVRFKPRLYAVNIGPMFSEEFIGKLGGVTEGVVENGFWHPDLPYEGARAFYDGYVAKYGKNPSTDAAYAYISTQVLGQAVAKAGAVDREKVVAALRTGKFATILGEYEYDQKGVNKNQLSFLCQVQDGKRVIVWPREIAKGQLKLPGK